MEVPRSRSESMTVLDSIAVRLRGPGGEAARLNFRSSAGFAGPGQSTTGHLIGTYSALAPSAVQDRPRVSTAVVSKALARSADGTLPSGPVHRFVHRAVASTPRLGQQRRA